jgi:uncharacterized membrane protein YfcA
MVWLLLVFGVTLISGLVSVTGGNGLILMPALLMLNYDIKEIMVVVRVSAVVFVLFNLLAMMREKRTVAFSKRDLIITLTSCLSVVLSVIFLNKLDNTTLMLLISAILIGLLLLVVFKNRLHKFSCGFIIILPVFAGICGSAIGGAGLIISIIYLLLGFDHVSATQKRIIPSLIIQILAFLIFINQGIKINNNLLITVVLATAIAGYLNMKMFLNLSPRKGKILFYASFLFSISNLVEDALENILHSYGMDWGNLL